MAVTDTEKRAQKRGANAPDLSDLPVRVPRDKAAKLVSQYFFQVSPRSMERWNLAWRRLNGKAHCETAELFARAGAMLAAAPPMMGGKRTSGK
jgi:hypothetical protein